MFILWVKNFFLYCAQNFFIYFFFIIFFSNISIYSLLLLRSLLLTFSLYKAPLGESECLGNPYIYLLVA